MRTLTLTEQQQLLSQGNWAEDWTLIKVTDLTDLSLIHNNTFWGEVKMGNLTAGTCYQRPRGIYGCTLKNSTLGNDCALHQVRWMEGYTLGNEVLLFNVGQLLSDPTIIKPLEVMNENGGRSVMPLTGMNPGMAYLWARYRGRKVFMRRLEEFTEHEISQGLGVIGDGTMICNVFTIKNVWFDCEVSVTDCPSLEDGVIDRGCRIESGAIAQRFVLGENVHLEMGLRMNDTIVGSNSTLARGEVCNSLIFNFHEQHHNSSFLIAALVQGQSNIASGCTIGSNHNGRTPEGELIAGRGFWPGLCCSFKHSSRFASYTLLAKGDYPSELNIMLPFSLVNNNVAKNQLEVMPAYWWMYNMYALNRNNTKFLARDKRKRKTQNIEYAVFAPDTIEEIITARALLREWTAQAYLKSKNEGGAPVVIGCGMENSKRPTIILKAAQAYEAYEEMLVCYAMSVLKDNTDYQYQGDRETNWINVGGQLLPERDVERLIKDTEQGKINSWGEIKHRLDELWEEYPEAKMKHAYKVLCMLAGTNTLEDRHWQDFMQRYLKIEQEKQHKIAALRQKDAKNAFRQMTYFDQDEQDAVLGC